MTYPATEEQWLEYIPEPEYRIGLTELVIRCRKHCDFCDGVGHYKESCHQVRCRICKKFGHDQTVCVERGWMFCDRCAVNGHFAYQCPRVRCFKCQKMGHDKTICSSVKCYSCGKIGHVIKHCTNRSSRMSRCWRCGEMGHTRWSRECRGAPNPKDWFCSYCYKKGTSTEACGCNSVNTNNLRRH